MNKKNGLVLFFCVAAAILFVCFAFYPAAAEQDWFAATAVCILSVSIVAAAAFVVAAEWGRPKYYRYWNRDRIKRSYKRNLAYARQWLNVGLGFAAATTLAIVPWLWNLKNATDVLGPWRLTLIALSFLLLILASGSFLMYWKYKRFYNEDDDKLGSVDISP